MTRAHDHDMQGTARAYRPDGLLIQAVWIILIKFLTRDRLCYGMRPTTILSMNGAIPKARNMAG
jgi:hypothetical protein